MSLHRIVLGFALLFAAMAFGAPASAQTSTSVSGSIQVVELVLVVNKTSDLSFGTVTKPTSGAGTVSIDANTGNVSVSNLSQVAGNPATRAAFTVTGEANRNIQVTYPSSFNMVRASGSETLQVNLTSTMGGGQIGSGGTVTFYLGGQTTLQSTTVTGAYSANFTVVVAYT